MPKHAPVTLVGTRDIGIPSTDKAASRIWQASTFLCRNRESDLTAKIARAHLLALCDHPSPAIRKHARKACLRFGVSHAVAVGFTLDQNAP